MIEKRLFKLLQYKLENNELITINREGILELLRLFVKDVNGNLPIVISINDPSVSLGSIPPPESITISKAFELIKLLFEKQIEQLEKHRIISDCIDYKRIELLELLVSPPISLKISNSSFESAIRKGNIKMIQCCLKYYKIGNHQPSNYYNGYLDGLVRIKNIPNSQKKHLNKNIEFILDNPTLFPIPNNPIISPTQYLYYRDSFNQLSHIVYVDSIELQNRILDLGYFRNSYNIKQFYQCILHFNNNNLNEPFSSIYSINIILLFFRIFCLCNTKETTATDAVKIITERKVLPRAEKNILQTIKTEKGTTLNLNDITKDIRFEILDIFSKNKENQTVIMEKLFILLVIKSKSKILYSLYYFKYYNLIEYEGMDGTKLLLNDSLKRLNLHNSIEILNQLEKQGDKDKIIEFIHKLFNDSKNNKNNSLNNYKKWGKYRVLINKIRDTIFSCMDTDEWYQKAINSIELSSSTLIKNKFGFPTSWNVNLKSIMVEPFKSNQVLYINDKEIIDYLLAHKLRSFPNKNSFLKCIVSEYLYKKNIVGMVKFKSNQLQHYSIHKLELNFLNQTKNLLNLYRQNKLNGLQLQWSQILDNPFYPDFFKEYNIDIDSSVVIPIDGDGDQSNQILKLIKSLTYISRKDDDSDGYRFGSIFIPYLKKKINYNQFISTTTHSYHWLDDNMNYFKPMINSLLNSIINFDLFTTKLILDGIKNFNGFSDSFLNAWVEKFHKEYLLFFKNQMFEYLKVSYLKEFNFETVLNYIKFWLNYINIFLIQNQQPPDNSLLIFNNIINFLYKKLIKIKGVTAHQVFEVRNLILKTINSLTSSSTKSTTNTTPTATSKSIIKLDHSFYHSFFYLNIKSPKFIKLIFLFHSVIVSPNNIDNYDKPISIQSLLSKMDIFTSVVDPNLFTFDYVIGDYYFENCGCISNSKSSYDLILNYLLDLFSCYYLGEEFKGQKPEIQQQQQQQQQVLPPNQLKKVHSYNQYLHIFSYFIDLKRMDLFFNELELLKKFVKLNRDNKQLEQCRYFYQYTLHFSIFQFFKNDFKDMVRYISLVGYICDDPSYYLQVLSNAIANHLLDYISLIINHYQISEFSRVSYKYSFISIHPTVFEYICINHPNIIFKDAQLPCVIGYLPIIILTKKYHPYLFDEWKKSKEIIDCIKSVKSRYVLLNKFYEIGLVDKDINKKFLPLN